MIATQEFVLEGLSFIEDALGNHTFTWLVDNNDYPCIASVSQFQRTLDTGGFRVEKLLTMTVRQYDLDGNYIFPNNVIPQSEQKLTYNGSQYRILSVHIDTIGTGARLRIMAIDTSKGL